jgi:hypothetical protein
MANQATPESRPDVPASWLVPISRRPVLKTGTGLALTAAANLLLPREAFAQSSGEPRLTFSAGEALEIFNIAPKNKPELQAVIWADPGFTKTSQIDAYSDTPYAAFKKEDLGSGYVRYSYSPPLIPTRNPNVYQERDSIILAKDGVVIGKRRMLGKDTPSDSLVPYNKYSKRDEIIELSAPKYYEVIYPGRQIWTRFNPQLLGRGFGVLADHLTGNPLELHAFPAGLSFEDYKKLLQQMDAKAVEPAPASNPEKASASKLDTVLIGDGLGSNSEAVMQTFAQYIPGLKELFRSIVPVSYRGPGLNYKAEDTFKHPAETAKALKETVDQHKPSWPLYGIWYSLMNPVFREYALEFVEPADAPHHKGAWAGIIGLHGPINGTLDMSVWTEKQTGVTENFMRNPATQYLNDLAKDEEMRQRTVERNTTLFRNLWRNSNVWTALYGNKDDCLTTELSVLVPDITKMLNLGNDVPSCNPLIWGPSVALSPNRATRIGHTQLLDAKVFEDEIKPLFLNAMRA